MKTFVVSAISIVLMIILSCPMVMAAPPMPNDVQIVQPDPSLPKDLLDFFGKWEGNGSGITVFLVVERIDEEKATVHQYISGSNAMLQYLLGWQRYEAKVDKTRGKYSIWYTSPIAVIDLEAKSKGKYLNMVIRTLENVRLTRVP